jgi:hypothetical protein
MLRRLLEPRAQTAYARLRGGSGFMFAFDGLQELDGEQTRPLLQKDSQT